MCKPTVEAMACMLMRSIRSCIYRPTLSWRFKLDNPLQKLAVLVDADHASDETTRKSVPWYHTYLGQCLIETQRTVALSSEFHALNVGCAAGMLAMSCMRWMQLEHPTLTGRREVYSDSSSAPRRDLERSESITWIRDTCGRKRTHDKACSGQRDRHEHEHS